MFVSVPVLRRRFGRIETETPYSTEWVRAIKALVPAHYRSYQGDGVWAFDPCCYVLVVEITEWVFGRGAVDLVGDLEVPQFRGWAEKWQRYLDATRADGGWADDPKGGPRTPPETRRDVDPYSALYLVPGAPREVVDAAYRALAKLHHPDRGGDTARMQAINAAYDRIKAGFEEDAIPFG